jgi:hypothetical protein
VTDGAAADVAVVAVTDDSCLMRMPRGWGADGGLPDEGLVVSGVVASSSGIRDGSTNEAALQVRQRFLISKVIDKYHFYYYYYNINDNYRC